MTRKELEELFGDQLFFINHLTDVFIEKLDINSLNLEGNSKEEIAIALWNNCYFNTEFQSETAPALTTTSMLFPEPEVEEKKKHTKIAIHAANQFHSGNKELSLFSPERVEAFSSSTGIKLNGVKPDGYGVILNTAQRRVFEGILKAFSGSNYSGDRVLDKAQYGQHYKRLPNAYDNIDNIPVVKITQAELITLSGYDLKTQRQGDKVDVTEALRYLATKQFCFYWLRLKHDDKGKPVKDKNGDYVKEEVMEVGTLIRLKVVKAEGAEKIDYYEIAPTAVILDQIDSYFLLIPNNWREEVKELTGKRGSSYTYDFLFWLRLQYENIRRNNSKRGAKKKEYCISKSWEEIAKTLKMPPTMYKANRKRAHKIIEEAYSIAITLGYLLKVETAGAVDKLYLNDGFYPQPGELI